MKKALMALLMIVACSGQRCGVALDNGVSGLDNTGAKNICGRTWFDTTYRIGINLPQGIGNPQIGGTNEGVEKQLTWQWNGTNPATSFILVISPAGGGITIEQVGRDSKSSFQQSNFTVVADGQITLEDSADAWYFDLSRDDQQNISVEMVMTLTQDRLVTLSATYSTQTAAGAPIPQEQADAILNVLKSLCADVE